MGAGSTYRRRLRTERQTVLEPATTLAIYRMYMYAPHGVLKQD
jgi:hypothetical protein